MEKELLHSLNIIKKATGVEPFIFSQLSVRLLKPDAVKTAKKHGCCVIRL
jgi:hypothetical protein